MEINSICKYQTIANNQLHIPTDKMTHANLDSFPLL